jgi:serine/threonine-protein kinase HipA
LYDVLSAWPIIGKKANEIPLEKIKLAMALPGERPRYLLQSIQRRHFEALAKKLGLAAEANTLIDEMIAATPAAIETVNRALPKGFPQSLFERVFAGLAKSARTLAGEP